MVHLEFPPRNFYIGKDLSARAPKVDDPRWSVCGNKPCRKAFSDFRAPFEIPRRDWE